jgi:hypothetical protein
MEACIIKIPPSAISESRCRLCDRNDDSLEWIVDGEAICDWCCGFIMGPYYTPDPDKLRNAIEEKRKEGHVEVSWLVRHAHPFHRAGHKCVAKCSLCQRLEFEHDERAKMVSQWDGLIAVDDAFKRALRKLEAGGA